MQSLSRFVSLALALCSLVAALPRSAIGQAGPGLCFPDSVATPSAVRWDDVVATPDRSPVLVPGSVLPFPKSFYRDKYRGRAMTEFVVDTAGRVERGTITLIEVSDAAFGRWACDTALGLRMSPADSGGRKVRALVRLPFSFSATIRRR